MINKILRKFGYEPSRKHYSLHSYGEFDYERYRKIQEEGNKAKINNVWVLEPNIKFLAQYLLRHMQPKFGICHGTRRGLEQKWFAENLQCEVIGTEISETATQFENTIQWDFHDVKPEWLGSVDFIYSNSFDHSYKPEECLNAWVSCLKPGGMCILEHTSMHEPYAVNELDPFGATIISMPYLIATWGKGEYGLRELLEAPERSEAVSYLTFLVVQKW